MVIEFPSSVYVKYPEVSAFSRFEVEQSARERTKKVGVSLLECMSVRTNCQSEVIAPYEKQKMRTSAWQIPQRSWTACSLLPLSCDSPAVHADAQQAVAVQEAEAHYPPLIHLQDFPSRAFTSRLTPLAFPQHWHMAEIEKLDTLQAVELAEGIEIRLRMAGPMLRAGAYVIDLLIRAAVLTIGGIIMGFAGIAIGGKVVGGVMMLAWFLMDWLYPVIFEAGKRGATPGKRAMGLRVVQATGSPITLGQAVVRNFLRFIDGMPFFTYIFGVTSCLATRRFQRLGDLAAGTVVIYDRIPPLPVITAPPPINALPLPVGLTANEMRALALFRERAGLWSDGRRAEIADQVEILSGATGAAGVSRLMAMAHWVQEKRRDR